MRSILFFVCAFFLSSVVLADTVSLDCVSRDGSVVLTLDKLIIAEEPLLASDAETVMGLGDRTYTELADRSRVVADLKVLKVSKRQKVSVRGGEECSYGNMEAETVEKFKVLVDINTSRDYSLSAIELTCTEVNRWESTCDR